MSLINPNTASIYNAQCPLNRGLNRQYSGGSSLILWLSSEQEYTGNLPTVKPVLITAAKRGGGCIQNPLIGKFTLIKTWQRKVLILPPSNAKLLKKIDGTSTVGHMKSIKDTQLWANFSLISLINIDVKLLTKVLANRLNQISHHLVSWDQTGFGPLQQATDIISPTLLLTNLADYRAIPLMLVSSDI